MSFVRGAWRVLVGVKDALVLLFMLLFFGLIWAALSARPNAASVTNGALLVDLDGTIVEQPEQTDPFAAFGMGRVTKQHRLRDVVRAIETAATDDRIKVVVLDLNTFLGGGQAALQRVGDAIDTVKRANKPVFAYATGYTDDSYSLAAHASEIWLEPLGLTLFTGPGGSRLYYKGLIDRLGVTAHVYRVGTYKSFVEPYERTEQSPEAKQADQAVAGAVFQQWLDDVSKARPKAQLTGFIAQPAERVTAAGGNLAQAALQAGLVDKLGDWHEFAARVAKLAGPEAGKPVQGFAHTKLDNWVAANPLPTSGDAIGVITVAGEIVDGFAGPGSAGGDTISKLLRDGLAANNLKALVVRVDSPGGSVLASEKIRQAILEAKRRGLPVVVSMGSLAASGGYWVATPGDRIFADPSTLTGSIGVFGIIPTFENALAKIGVTSDGVTTTPLSGQPDIIGGTNAAFDTVIQSSVEASYARFVNLVAASRKLSPARVDQIAQGRVWDGGTARQLGLVDQFGTLDDAIAEAARRAKLDPASVRPLYLEKAPDFAATLFQGWTQPDEEGTDAAARDVLTRMARLRIASLLNAVADAETLVAGPVLRAHCLECPRPARMPSKQGGGLFATLMGWAIG